jgi:hypothetical protein
VHPRPAQKHPLDSQANAWRKSTCGPTVHALGGPAIRQAGALYRVIPVDCTKCVPEPIETSLTLGFLHLARALISLRLLARAEAQGH